MSFPFKQIPRYAMPLKWDDSASGSNSVDNRREKKSEHEEKNSLHNLNLAFHHSERAFHDNSTPTTSVSRRKSAQSAIPLYLSTMSKGYDVVKTLSETFKNSLPVLIVRDKTNRKLYIAKIQQRKPKKNNDLDFNKERVFLHTIYPRLKRDSYIAKLFDIGFDDDFRYLILEEHGRDLMHFYTQFRPFDAASTFLITYHTFQAIKELHNHGFFHIDLRPSAFAISSPFRLKLVDFYRVTPIKTQRSILYKPDRFSARCLHLKTGEYTQFDDIESWLYVVLFVTSQLPWGKEDKDRILAMKDKTIKNPELINWSGTVDCLPVVPYLLENYTNYKDFCTKMDEMFSIEAMPFDTLDQPNWVEALAEEKDRTIATIATAEEVQDRSRMPRAAKSTESARRSREC